MVQLTLDDAVKLALDRNLDIAVQRLNPEINDIAIASMASFYHPTLTSTVGPQSNTILPTSQTTLGTGVAAPSHRHHDVQRRGRAEHSVGRRLVQRVVEQQPPQTARSATTLYNPLYQSTWTVAYTQPLLRNFRIDATRQQLAVTKINRDISDVQLRVDDHQHAVERPQRLLGLRLRRAVGRRRPAVGGSRRTSW